MVYVAQRPGRTGTGYTPDLQSAKEYGPLEFVFETGDRVSVLPGPSLKKARNVLANFDYRMDYILWPGIADPAAFFCCAMALGEFQLPFIRLLVWDRRKVGGDRIEGQGSYTPVKFERLLT